MPVGSLSIAEEGFDGSPPRKTTKSCAYCELKSYNAGGWKSFKNFQYTDAEIIRSGYRLRKSRNIFAPSGQFAQSTPVASSNKTRFTCCAGIEDNK